MTLYKLKSAKGILTTIYASNKDSTTHYTSDRAFSKYCDLRKNVPAKCIILDTVKEVEIKALNG